MKILITLIFAYFIFMILSGYPDCRRFLRRPRGKEIIFLLSACVFNCAAFCLLRDPLPAVIFIPVFAAVSYTDMKLMEISDSAVLITAAVSVYCEGSANIVYAAAAAGFLTLFSLYGKIGFGDVKLISAFTLYAGELIFVSLAAASSLALLYTVFRKNRHDLPVPFAPFLCVGFILILFLKEAV